MYKECLDSLPFDRLEELVELMRDKIAAGKQIIVFGNGGSAATASHFAADVSQNATRKTKGRFNAICLNDSVTRLTAVANDLGFEYVFKEQLYNFLKKDDVVMVISGSGNSPNIIKAVKYAKTIGSTIVGCTGFNGGALLKLADISFHVNTPDGEYGLVEDMHVILDHLVHSYFLSWQKEDK